MGKTLMKEDVNYSSNNRTDQQKPVTNNEEFLVKATKEVKLKKKGALPKDPLEMDLVPYPPKFKQPNL